MNFQLFASEYEKYIKLSQSFSFNSLLWLGVHYTNLVCFVLDVVKSAQTKRNWNGCEIIYSYDTSLYWPSSI